ncbi:DUF4136 domain-containing protein [Fulvivirga lutea]|uniref:DUF4136 domain-containing protein n=1 Tax=Fulvivirga lutea TaxID=2810512 RepID=A0A974WEF6_9BACT|nr:DUF4136 domain-containing protein [Fulvivirga lutea]QSE96300.1 DUF4136 domain-containing protein [Fulvivirga lutea]
MKKIAIPLLLILAACGEYTIESQQDPKADFSQYKTWCWLNNCTPSFEGPDYIYSKAVLEDITNAIAEEMYNKGYEQGDENSDLMLNYHVVIKEDSALNSIVHEEALPLWEHYDESERYYHFLKGTLIIDVADRELGQIVFRSITEKYLPAHPKMNYAEVKEGIKRALEDLPKRTKTEEKPL